MKKTLVSMLVLGLVAGAMVAPADAKKKKKKSKRIERVVEIAYDGGNLGVATPAASGGVCFPGGAAFACQEAPTLATDLFVKVEVQDASGQKVGGFLSQNDHDGDGIQDGYGTFCGAHAEPVPVESPGAMMGISLYPGACEDGSPSVVTTGTVILTFSNMP